MGKEKNTANINFMWLYQTYRTYPFEKSKPKVMEVCGSM